MPDSSKHSLYLMKLFVFSCPEGNKLRDCSIRLRPFSKHNERSDGQYRHELPPAFALLKPRSPSFKSLLRPLSRSPDITAMGISFRPFHRVQRTTNTTPTHPPTTTSLSPSSSSHTYTHNTHNHKHTQSQAQTQSKTQTHTHTQHTQRHTQTHMHMYMYMPMYMSLYMYMYLYLYMHM